MAHELTIAVAATPTSGRTVTASLYRDGQLVGGNVSLAEIGASGVYTGDAPTPLSAGIYGVVFRDAAQVVGTGDLAWDGTREFTILDVQGGGGGGGGDGFGDDDRDKLDLLAAYPPPDNARIAAIDNRLPADPAAVSDVQVTVAGGFTAADRTTLGSRLAASAYTPPDNAGVGTLIGRLTADRAAKLDRDLAERSDVQGGGGPGGGGGGPGPGIYPVNHDSGGTDRLRILVAGQPSPAELVVVVREAWVGGDFSPLARGRAVATGRWQTPIYLDPGVYVLVTRPPGAFQGLTTITVASGGGVTAQGGVP